MQSREDDKSEEKNDENIVCILEALEGLNHNISVINDRIEILFLSELPGNNAKYDLNEAYEAVIHSRQLLLRLVIRCLRVFDRKSKL